MEKHERHMLAFAILASESRNRQQDQGELRFLLLTGTAACRAGFAKVAEACYRRVLEVNPHHMLANYTSLPEALKSPDFLTLVSRLDRFCTFEHAELLLEKHQPGWDREFIEDLENKCLSTLTGEMT